MSISELQARLGDRYTLEQELGRGGMGTVYLARDLKLDRLVALKVLPAEYERNPDLHARFVRETKTAASFSHPNIVPVHSVEEREGVLAYSMGLVEGESVAQRVARDGPLSVREIVRLLQDIGYALAYAHGRGVVHRDIKPDNIMLERATGRALLMDFGISRPMSAPVSAAALTRVGEVVGTPEYMSPEQASGDVVDGRSDIYSLGLVAWFCTTGQTAMAGESVSKVIVRQLTERVPGVESVRPELPDLLSGAIDRCVEKDPSARFPTAEALVEAVEQSQLAGPEVPLPLRAFASEVETLTLVLLFLLLFGWHLTSTFGAGGEIDSLIPAAVLLSIAVTRTLQTRSEARHLADLGFSPDDTVAGLRTVHEERDAVRAAKRADAGTVARRRRTVRMGAGLVVVAVVLIVVAATTRVPSGDGIYSTPTHGVVLLFSGLGMIGGGMALLARSPFRPSLVERLVRRIWLGAPGRWLLRHAARGAVTGVRARLAPLATLPAAHRAPEASSPRRDSAEGSPQVPRDLERRVAALEDWRRATERRGV